MNTDNIIFIYGEIDNSNISDTIERIVQIETINNASISNDIEPIHLHIISEGGDILAGLALIDVIKSINTPVYTYCHGYCHSIAVYIYLCGQKRFAYDNSEFILHNSKASFDSMTYDNVKNFLHRYEEYEDTLSKILYDTTNITEDIFISLNVDNKDCILGIDQALSYNIVTDRIIPKR